MKNTKLFGLALVVTMASFTACSNDAEEVITQESEIKLTSEITPSRVTNSDLQSTQIVVGQKVGITITGAKSEHEDVVWIVEEDGSLKNTGDPLYWSNEDITIIAFHPYLEWNGNQYVGFEVAQDQSKDADYLNSDILYTKQTASRTDKPTELTFSHKLSKINITLTSTDIKDLSNADVFICGIYNKGWIDTRNEGATSLASYFNDYPAIEIKAATTTSTATASAIIIPQEVKAGTAFIRVEHNNKSYYYKLPENKTFESGYSYNYKLKLNKKDEIELKSVEINPWNNTTEINEEIDEDLIEVIQVNTPGSLSSLIDEEKKNSITSLKVTGTLNADDISFIREMASRYSYSSYECTGNLGVLDLSEATISDGRVLLEEANLLRDIKLPEGIKELSLYYTSITSINIPSTIENLYLGYCNFLESINIPNGVKYIDLSYCTSLREVNIPNSAIKTNLSSCDALKNVTIPDGINILYESSISSDDGKALSLSHCKSLLAANIPNSVTIIESNAFWGCESMTTVNIPGSVETIEMDAFGSCKSLTTIEIQNGVKTIGAGAFMGCSSLPTITLPSSITEIGGFAFAGCISLTKVYCKATNPPTLGTDVFISASNSLPTIYVPASSVDKYKAATGWKDLNIVAEE